MWGVIIVSFSWAEIHTFVWFVLAHDLRTIYARFAHILIVLICAYDCSFLFFFFLSFFLHVCLYFLRIFQCCCFLLLSLCLVFTSFFRFLFMVFFCFLICSCYFGHPSSFRSSSFSVRQHLLLFVSLYTTWKNLMVHLGLFHMQGCCFFLVQVWDNQAFLSRQEPLHLAMPIFSKPQRCWNPDCRFVARGSSEAGFPNSECITFQMPTLY